MRKSMINSYPQNRGASDGGWLDLGRLASVEVTSEENGNAVECALLAEGTGGWRAAKPGPQTIRLIFDRPQTIMRIRMRFEESEHSRTQEFVPAMVFRWRAFFQRNCTSTVELQRTRLGARD